MSQIQPVSDYTDRVRRRVRAAIAEHGTSATKVARQLGWSQSAMSRRLQAKRPTPFTVEELASIAATLGIKPEALTSDREAVAA